ncbi:MAG: response regulator, partial [Oxalobacteraceae bacterium]
MHGRAAGRGVAAGPGDPGPEHARHGRALGAHPDQVRQAAEKPAGHRRQHVGQSARRGFLLRRRRQRLSRQAGEVSRAPEQHDRADHLLAGQCHAALPHAGASMRRAPMHILIVDDNDDDRAEMRRLLLQGSDEHYAFTEAETGQAALAAIAAAASRMPDCILLDYYLQDMEAPEVLDALRGADNAALCPVVVLTAAAEYSFGPLLLRAGAQDYLSKEHMTSPALTRAIANAIERWKMGREIMDRERELRMIADNTPDILSRFDRAHRHVFVNAAAERSSGHPAAYLIGKTKGELGAPAHLCQLWETAMEAAFTSGQAQSIEFSSGIGPGRHHYAARLVPELSADGAVNHVLGVTHDITERRHAESLIKASAERLEMALAAARSGVWE